MTRYSLTAWQATMAASRATRRVFTSSGAASSTSSKAQLSKISTSSGPVAFSVETWPGNSAS